jgi:beta-1,4-mannosyltransferase
MASVKTVFISNWFDNPYKDLLISGLNHQDVEVSEYFRSTFFIQNIFKDGRSNIVHLQTLHYFFASRNPVFYWLKFLFFIIQILLLRVIGVQTVWTVHEWTDKISGGKHNLSPLQAKFLGKTLGAVITHCESTRQEMFSALHLKNLDKIFVVPHGHYIDYYENVLSATEAKQLLNVDPASTTFLYFGGIHPSKGVLDAIEAFKAVNSPRSNFLIAGKAGDKIQKAISAAIAGVKNINFVDPDNYVLDQDVQLYMNAADVVVLPYKVFTTSGVALLAMSFKKACIAPKSGFFQDILDQSDNFLYVPNTQLALQHAMQAAIAAHSSLVERGLHNFQTAQRYDWDSVAEQTVFIYHSLLGIL